jgi:hypothetical protein
MDALRVRSYSGTTARGHRSTAMSGFWYDMRSGLRQLQRHRAFTALAVGVLALGIGINSAIFSVVYTVFFKPWPIEKPDEVAFIYRNQWNGTTWPASFGLRRNGETPSRQDVLDSNPGVAALATYWGIPRDIEVGGLTERTWGEWVSPNYFDVLGIKPVA